MREPLIVIRGNVELQGDKLGPDIDQGVRKRSAGLEEADCLNVEVDGRSEVWCDVIVEKSSSPFLPNLRGSEEALRVKDVCGR